MERDSHTSWLSREYTRLAGLYSLQEEETRRFLRQQAEEIVSTLGTERRPIVFYLPERILLEGRENLDMSRAPRRRTVRRGLFSTGQAGAFDRLRRHLDALEASLNPALSLCGSLVKFSIVQHILQEPDPGGGEEPPTPGEVHDDPSISMQSVIPSGVLAAVNADGGAGHEPPGQYESHTSSVHAGKPSVLPQGVAFGEKELPATWSPREAETRLVRLQHSFRLVQFAEVLLPCVVADETYQKKRNAISEMLVNHGRRLASETTSQIIGKLHSREVKGSLNRGLQLSLPYFDHGDLRLKLLPIEVIPGGRIVFLESFVVRAMQQQKTRVAADIRFDPATRRHLMELMDRIEQAFTHPLSEG